MTLIEKLLDAGYPENEIFHHYSDLYIYANQKTTKIINEWFKEQGLNEKIFVDIFQDLITGKQMFDCAFQYYNFKER